MLRIALIMKIGILLLLLTLCFTATACSEEASTGDKAVFEKYYEDLKVINNTITQYCQTINISSESDAYFFVDKENNTLEYFNSETSESTILNLDNNAGQALGELLKSEYHFDYLFVEKNRITYNMNNKLIVNTFDGRRPTYGLSKEDKASYDTVFKLNDNWYYINRDGSFTMAQMIPLLALTTYRSYVIIVIAIIVIIVLLMICRRKRRKNKKLQEGSEKSTSGL